MQVYKFILFFSYIIINFVAANIKAVGPDILFSNFLDIRRFTYGYSNYSAVQGGLEGVKSIEYDYKEKLLFYFTVMDGEKPAIKSASLVKQGESKTVVEATSQSEPDGLAVDWVTKRLYYTDLETNRVVVCNYDGTHKRVIVSTGLDQPRGIAVLPQKGYMFVTDWGDFSKIERFDMDGRNKTILVKTEIKWPNSIAVDIKTELVYWSDVSLHTIEYMTVDGKNRKVIDVSKYGNAHYLSVSKNQLFWSDGQSTIYTCVKDQCSTDIKHIETLSNNAIMPFGLKVYSKDKQPYISSQCEIKNGGCSHLCLLNSVGYSCACPTGLALQEDRKTCERKMKTFLLIARKINIRVMSMDADTNVDILLPIKGIKCAIGIDYDNEEEKVYWADSNVKSITRAYLNGTGVEKIISYDVKSPDHVAIDWIARNLYWTDSGLNRIEISRLDGSSRKILISDNLEEPRGIAVDPGDGKIYWTEWGNEARIASANLDGKHREVLVKENLKWPNGIAVDYQGRKLYWANAKYKAVESYDLVKKIVLQVHSDSSFHPFGISVLGNYVYWTDWFRKVERFHVHTKQLDVILSGPHVSDVMSIKAVSIKVDYGSNSCYYRISNCSHLCFHIPKRGSYCACPTRMEISKDEKTCKVPSGFLLYSVSNGIKKLSIDTYRNSYKLPLSNVGFVSHLDTYYKNSRIFWLDTSPPATINRAFLNGSEFKSIVRTGLTAVQGIAVDWMAKNIYWVHNTPDRIEVSRLDGTHRKVLVYDKDVVLPKLLNVNPHISKIFWFHQDSGMNSFSMWEANLDGSNRKCLITKTNPWNAVIDYTTNKIYWADTDNSYTNIKCYDRSTNLTTVIREKIPQVRGLEVFEKSLIFGDNDASQNIVKIPINGSGYEVLVHNINADWVSDIKAFHGSVQTGSNICSINNGGCDHLCFALSNTKRVCSCATHYLLKDNVCSLPPNFMIFSHESLLVRLLFEPSQPEAILPVTINKSKGVKVIKFDEVRYFLYILYPVQKLLVRSFQDGSHYKTINLVNESDLKKSVVSPHDFSIDILSNALYWTDDNRNLISYLHLDSFNNGTVFKQNNYYPRKIITYPEIGRMFWTSVDEVNHRSLIVSTTLAGSDLKHLQSFDKSTILKDITLDFVKNRIYWLDTGRNKIASVGMIHGTDVRYHNEKISPSPVSIAVYNKHLYWAEKTTKFIYKAWKDNITAHSSVFHGKYDDLSSLLVVNLTRKEVKHPCKINNGGCSHMCSFDFEVDLSPGKTVATAHCACPLMQTPDASGKQCLVSRKCISKDEFYCQSDSTCIESSLKCDFKDDCLNGEDEKDCGHVIPPCNSGFISCGKHWCININKRCDGVRDCPVNEDEIHCDHCGAGKFQCDGSTCLDIKRKCDAFRDCQDGKDELNCKKYINGTSVPGTVDAGPKKSRIVAGIISGVIICIIVLMFGILLWFKLRNSKKNAAREQENNAVWQLTQLNNRTESVASDDHAKNSVSTYISNVSQKTEQSYYDRNNVTGASSSAAVSTYTHIPLNPPPSPVTERALSTITESCDPYGYVTCEHCRNIIEEVPMEVMSEMGHDAPPPTLASMSLLDDVDLYYPIQQPVQLQQKRICDSCQINRPRKGRRSNCRRDPSYRSKNGSVHNSVIRFPEKCLPSEMEPLQRQWLYQSQNTNHNSHYNADSLYDNVNNRHLHFDPPPTPCTNYMSEEEDRPPSPTITERSLPFNTILNGGTHYAPPPSPTSQL